MAVQYSMDIIRIGQPAVQSELVTRDKARDMLRTHEADAKEAGAVLAGEGTDWVTVWDGDNFYSAVVTAHVPREGE